MMWRNPETLTPPHGVTHPEKVEMLAQEFAAHGWGKGYPALVGYTTADEQVQLLSGSHRWAAARLAKIAIPVVVIPFTDICAAWGDEEAWQRIMLMGIESNKL
jgi:ParB-like chromosome segregation protein Spo0J